MNKMVIDYLHETISKILLSILPCGSVEFFTSFSNCLLPLQLDEKIRFSIHFAHILKIFETTVATSCDPYQKYSGNGMADCIEHYHGAKEMRD